ncbi:hypothetical protein HK099_000156 [Clydaea vesicula]|uniref:G-protein coupled receptors family 3 profile domain-containing protein n=1 Tax=Clydaea vesicula TaxID=447962 RepID=A0AAD5XXM6_9FUNG|nr:hypothetical protein HK099_000156 [Clydaea vesicula]
MVNINSDATTAYEDVRDDKSATNWLLLGYVDDKKDDLSLVGTGSGGLTELKTFLKPDQANFGYIRVTVGNDELRKAKLSVHISDVKNVLKAFAIEIAACDLEDLDSKKVDLLVKKAMGLRDWDSQILVSYVTDIILREAMGANTVLVDCNNAIKELLTENPELPSDNIQLTLMEHEKIFLNVEYWPPTTNTLELSQKLGYTKIISGGPIGYTGKIGWYLPEKWVISKPQLESWRAYTSTENTCQFKPNTSLNCGDAVLKPLQQVSDVELSDILNLAKNCENAANSGSDGRRCAESILNGVSHLTHQIEKKLPKGRFNTVKETWTVFDKQIIKSLNLELEPYLMPDFTEQKLVDEMIYSALNDIPYIGYFYTPHWLLSSKSPIKLTSMYIQQIKIYLKYYFRFLPTYNSKCSEALLNGTYNCDYPDTYLYKLVTKKFLEVAPDALTFVQQFIVNEDALLQMLYDKHENSKNLSLSPEMGYWQAACEYVKQQEDSWRRFIPPGYRVKTEEVLELNSPVFIGVQVLYMSNLLITILSGALVIYHRNRAEVKSISLLSLIQILTGLSLTWMSIYANAGPLTLGKCLFKQWNEWITLSVVLGSILPKSYRLFQIFENTNINKPILQTQHLFAVTTAIVLGEALILLGWTFTSPLVPTVTSVNSESYFYQCSSKDLETKNAFIYALLLYNGILIMTTFLLAYKTRNAFERYRESTRIANSSIVITLIALIGMIVLGNHTRSTLTQLFLVRSILIAIAGMVTYACLIGKTVVNIFLSTYLVPDIAVGKGKSGEESSCQDNFESSYQKVDSSQKGLWISYEGLEIFHLNLGVSIKFEDKKGNVTAINFQNHYLKEAFLVQLEKDAKMEPVLRY